MLISWEFQATLPCPVSFPDIHNAAFSLIIQQVLDVFAIWCLQTGPCVSRVLAWRDHQFVDQHFPGVEKLTLAVAAPELRYTARSAIIPELLNT